MNEAFGAPVDRLLGTIQIDSQVVMLANTAPWDGAPCGRLHTIVRHTPALQRGRVGDFLKCYNPVSGVVGEILQPPPWDAPVDALSSDDENLPFVLLSRYRENLYIIFANIPGDILPTVRFCVAALLRSTYGIALKWEIHDCGPHVQPLSLCTSVCECVRVFSMSISKGPKSSPMTQGRSLCTAWHLGRGLRSCAARACLYLSS